MLRAVLNISWQDHVTNEVLCGVFVLWILDGIARKRLGQTGHCSKDQCTKLPTRTEASAVGTDARVVRGSVDLRRPSLTP